VEIRELRTYLAVVEEGGISAAARRLHRSQSSVSDTIASLERELGLVLLHRGRGGAAETAAGRRLTAGARRLVRAHDRLRTELATAPREATVRVGVPLELPADLLPGVITALTAADVRVEVQHASTASQWEALRGGELDVGLVRELRPGEEYDASLVAEDRLGVVLLVDRAAELTGPDGSIALQRLSGMTWNGFARSDSPASYDSMAATLRAHGIHVPDTDDGRPRTVTVKLAEVADGSRFALALPDFPLNADMAWRPLAGEPLVRRTWAVWRADETSRSVAAVVGALEAGRRDGE
jgi:molybdate transport repressor ModE-like protein